MNKKTLYFFFIGFLLLIVVTIINRRSFNSMRDYTSAVDYSREVVNSLERLSNHFKSAQIYSLQYEIQSGQELYLLYKAEAEGVLKEAERLKVLIKDNPEQRRRLDSIDTWIEKHMDLLLEKNLAEIINSGEANRLNEIYIIHLGINEAIAHELNVLAIKSADLKRSTKLTSLLTVLFSIVAAALIAWAFVSNLFLARKREWLEGFLQSVLNTTQNGIVTYKAIRNDEELVDFEIEFTNPAIRKLLNVEPHLMTGKRLKDTHTYRQDPSILGKYIDVVENDTMQEFEIYYDHNQQQRWFYVMLSKRGEGVTATFHDISELKLYEEELKDYIKQLEYSNKELEQYAYAASHDLQEPLRKIRTFGNFLEESQMDRLDEKGKGYLQKITKSAERMSVLISDILTFSSLKKEAAFIETDLDEVLRNVIQDLELLIGQTETIITIDPMPRIQAVPMQMNQLFYNLINNAVKFKHPDRKPEIRISSQLVEKRELTQFKMLRPQLSYIRITCTDNGLGFEQRMAEQIFGLFKRLGDRQSFPGSGIGLALCRKVVLNHHGYIYAQGEENKGATFHIILPLVQPVKA
jgi:signal transduction histidine kinase